MTNRKCERHEASFVLAGGGVAGLGHIAGKLKAIEDFSGQSRDELLGDVPILGTSAGSIAGGFAVAGVEFEHIADIKQFGWPDCLLQPRFLQDMLTDVYANARDISFEEAKNIKAANVEATVFRVASLLPWRLPGLQKINGADVPLPTLGAASSAVPGVFPPVRIGADFYVDGGVGGSASHIKLGRSAIHTIVVAPMAEHFMPPVGGLFENMLIREIDNRQRNQGGNVVYLRPNRKVGRVVTSLLDVFNVDKGRKIYDLSYEQMFGVLEKYVGDEGRVDLADIAIRLAQHPEFTTPAHQRSKPAVAA